MFVVRELTIKYYKCPPCDNEYISSGISFKDNFKTMFEKPSPWLGINQTLFRRKKVDIDEIDDNY